MTEEQQRVQEIHMLLDATEELFGQRDLKLYPKKISDNPEVIAFAVKDLRSNKEYLIGEEELDEGEY